MQLLDIPAAQSVLGGHTDFTHFSLTISHKVLHNTFDVTVVALLCYTVDFVNE